MKTAIALRHIHFEDVGTLDTVMLEHGYELRYIDPTLEKLDDPALQRADLLIVLGGPIGACDEQVYPFLEPELAVVRQRLETGRPLLGICLGAQLIARARGAKVYPLGIKEIGFSPLALTPAGEDSVLAGLGDTEVLHWHGDQFDIPDGAVRLASTPAGANQAFSIGPNVLGLQFHLEADARTLERWLVGHASELGQAGIDPRALRADAARFGERLAGAARRVISDWLDNLEAGPGHGTAFLQHP
ncbi:glutamine amidotransferase [Verminephrobacter aporrectodeae subsp. tuberculatae]|uniref:glutamine amidotransferase n=1 Tax=Verminephrobacter aporrectodeae TaxID=1110389 RepID=UPI002243BDE2|nr:glutamine amidotransferase [Verminephrobacter aporrectodeae]MCW8208946.1 glutamine amidotransferase [Verminephrobacter aporrectodeae subsp. tuberculatae]